MPTTPPIYANAGGDGAIRKFASGTGWFATARDAATGDDTYASNTGHWGCQVDPANGLIQRSFYPFNTGPEVPDGATITGASLFLYSYVAPVTGGGGSTDNKSACIVASTQASPTALVAADYDQVGSTLFAGRVPFSSFPSDGYIEIPLNASGLAALSKTGWSLLALRAGYDLDNVAPVTNEAGVGIKFADETGTGKDPYLVITYEEPGVSASDVVVVSEQSAVKAIIDPAPAGGGGIVTVIGDSEFWCHGLSRTDSWPYQLAQILSGGQTPTLETLTPWSGWVESGVPTTGANRKHVAGGWTIRNAGVNGNTTKFMVQRFATDVLGASPLPDYCVIGGPENDLYMKGPPNNDATHDLDYSPGGIKENVIWMVNQCVANGIVPILTTPMPHGGVEGIGTRWQDMQDYLKWIGSSMGWISSSEVANTLGLTLIDIYKLVYDAAHPEYPANYPNGLVYSLDNVHPNAAGGFLIASAVAEAIATDGRGTDAGSAFDSASVSILSETIPKTAADTAAAADSASVQAQTPAAVSGADTAAASDQASVVEAQIPIVIQAGAYDLRLGRIRLPTLLDSLKESVGEQLETVGQAVLAGERRARPANLTIPVHADPADGKAVGDRMRRQLRALLDNPSARMGALYLAFAPDAELSGWLLIGGGDLEYADGGVSLGDYKLTLSDAYQLARLRSHRPARRVEVADRRLSTTPRDIEGLVYSTAFASVTPAAVAYLPGAPRVLRNGAPWTGEVVTSVQSLMGVGTPQLVQGLQDGDLLTLDGPPDDAQLQAGELGDVIILDRQQVAASGVSAARDITPQQSYGWEELYGPNQPIGFPSGVPTDVVVQNGVCRVTVSSGGVFTVDRLTSSGFSAACTVQPLNGPSASLQLRDAQIVRWTPDEAVVRFELDNTQVGLSETHARCRLYLTVRRGESAPRVEAYLDAGLATSVVRLRVLPSQTGNVALDTSTTDASNITDDTDYGTFAARDPWLTLAPTSGPVIAAAISRATAKIRGRVQGSQRGVEIYDPTPADTSYASVLLALTSDGPGHGQRSLADVRLTPTFLPR